MENQLSDLMIKIKQVYLFYLKQVTLRNKIRQPDGCLIDMKVVLMKKFIILLFIILGITISARIYSVDCNFYSDISINNQGLNIDNLLKLQSYIINEKKDSVLKLEGGDLSVNIDMKNGINITVNSNYTFGYFEIENNIFSAIEDTARCFFGDGMFNGKYDLNVDYLKQEVKGICLGKFFNYNENIRIGVIAKYLKGTRLERQYYEGIIEREDKRNYLTGRRITFDSDFYKETEMFEVDFKSNGWGFDLYTQWLINENNSLSLSLKNIYSKILWENVFVEYMNYNKASLGLFDNDKSSSSGFFDFEDYVTVLPEYYDIQYQNGKYSAGIKYYRDEFIPYFNYQLTDYFNLGFYKYQVKFSFKSKLIDINISTNNINILNAEEAMCKVLFKFSF